MRRLGALLVASGCASGTGEVEVWLVCDRPVSMTVEEVGFLAEGQDWNAPWTTVELTETHVDLDGEEVRIAEGSLPPDTWVHVFPDVAEAVSGEVVLTDIVEPIAARFRMPPGGQRSVVLTLLVLDDTPEGPALFVVDSSVSR